MHSYFETLGKYLLFTKYLTSTNMPTAQQKKRAQIGPTEILVCFRLFFKRIMKVVLVIFHNKSLTPLEIDNNKYADVSTLFLQSSSGQKKNRKTKQNKTI